MIKAVQIKDVWRLVDDSGSIIREDGIPMDGGGIMKQGDAETMAEGLNTTLKAMEPQIKEVALSSFSDFLPKAMRVKIKEVLKPDAKVLRVPVISEVKAVDDEDKMQATFYLSTRELDRDGDVVMPKGFDLTLYKLNPVVLWVHNYREQPVGKAVEIQSDDYGLKITIQYADTDLGKDIWKLVKGGFLRTMSAGFDPTAVLWRDDEGFSKLLDSFESDWPEFSKQERDQVQRIIQKAVLIEASMVPVPANPFALQSSISKGEVKLSDTTIKALKMPAPVVKKQPVNPQGPPPKAPEIKIREVPKGVKITQAVEPVRVFTKTDVEKMVKKGVDKARGAV